MSVHTNRVKSSHHGPNVVKRRARGFARKPSVDWLTVRSSRDVSSTGGEQVVGDARGRDLHNGACVSSTGVRATRTVSRRSRGRRLLASDIMVCSCERRLAAAPSSLQNEDPSLSSETKAFLTRSSRSHSGEPRLCDREGPETMRRRVREREGPSSPTTYQQHPVYSRTSWAEAS